MCSLFCSKDQTLKSRKKKKKKKKSKALERDSESWQDPWSRDAKLKKKKKKKKKGDDARNRRWRSSVPAATHVPQTGQAILEL